LFQISPLPLPVVGSAQAEWWRTWPCLATEGVARLATNAPNPAAKTSIESCFLSEIFIVAAFLIRLWLGATIAGANNTGGMSVPPNAFGAMTIAMAA
jgi:hypothetical protein